jgi:short-subunit dehydrogenase
MESMVRASRYAVVTGASSGIGRELAAILAREGYGLVLVARRTGPMQELAAQLQQAHGVPSVVVGADLSEPEGVQTVVNELKTRQLDVEVLVNNAGFGLAGNFEVLPAEQQVGMLELNVRALTALTRGPMGTSNARQVAEAGYRGLVRGKPMVVPGISNRLSAWFLPLAPLALRLRISEYMNASES